MPKIQAMKRILTAIDFSEHSKRTIRFALQLASQLDAEVTFLHIIGGTVPVVDAVSDYVYYAQFHKEDLVLRQNQLVELVKSAYDGPVPETFKSHCVCELGEDISSTIISYAIAQKADLICVGARDSDIMTKLFGSVASHLIRIAPVPVAVVPRNYRIRPLQKICYATDMNDLATEMKTVMAFTEHVSAKLNVIHINYEVLLKQNKGKWTDAAAKYQTEGVSFQFKKLNTLFPLNDYLRKVIETSKPSLLVLFIRQDRNWLDRLIQSSKSAELSFTSKVPLLVYRKN